MVEEEERGFWGESECGKGGLGLERVRRGSKEGVISRRERLDDEDDDDDEEEEEEEDDDEVVEEE